MTLRQKDQLLKYRIVIFALIILIAILILWNFVADYLTFDLSFLPELSTVGYVQPSLDLETNEDQGVISFIDGCYEMSMNITRDQAVSIENGLGNIIVQRPNTHDIVNDMMRSFNIKVVMVKITEMRNETCQENEGCDFRITYLAKLFLRQGGYVLGLDSRPSDAIAIAARTDYDVPIYLNESILTTVGRNVC